MEDKQGRDGKYNQIRENKMGTKQVNIKSLVAMDISS